MGRNPPERQPGTQQCAKQRRVIPCRTPLQKIRDDTDRPAALADPACIMVNRNQGAGTRILIDRLLDDKDYAAY